MNVKLLTEHHLEFLTLKKEAAQARLSLHLSKCHIDGNHISQIIFILLKSCVPSALKTRLVNKLSFKLLKFL